MVYPVAYLLWCMGILYPVACWVYSTSGMLAMVGRWYAGYGRRVVYPRCTPACRTGLALPASLVITSAENLISPVYSISPPKVGWFFPAGAAGRGSDGPHPCGVAPAPEMVMATKGETGD